MVVGFLLKEHCGRKIVWSKWERSRCIGRRLEQGMEIGKDHRVVFGVS